jgi:methylase of polypeptide subunit release factors
MQSGTANQRLAAFGPLLIAFDDNVLHPRSWTVMQSEWAAELSPTLADGPMLELFAGAGQIGLLAAVLTGRRLVQVEINPAAASFAAANAATARVADRVDVRCAAIEAALMDDERFPLIVADPPYLASADISRFPDDPVIAIDGGGDGLDLVRATLDVVRTHMAPGGACLLQVAGPAQVRAVATLVDEGWPQLAASASRAVDAERAVALVTFR